MDEICRIVLISTGGTIEKTYDERDGKLENKRPVIFEKLVARLRLPHTELEVDILMHKDSLHMTEEDREEIANAVEARQEGGFPIVILHGTDTMDKTVAHVVSRINPRVPIVFTGAMRPVEFEDSDAIQNVTEALIAAQVLPPGVYLSFHNRIFAGPGFTKNREIGTFVSAPTSRPPNNSNRD